MTGEGIAMSDVLGRLDKLIDNETPEWRRDGSAVLGYREGKRLQIFHGLGYNADNAINDAKMIALAPVLAAQLRNLAEAAERIAREAGPSIVTPGDRWDKLYEALAALDEAIP